MPTARAFRGFRCPAEVLLWAVRWSLPFPISCRGLGQRLADRGVAVDHTTLSRWVQRFAPELEKRMRRHLRRCRGPWPVDETEILSANSLDLVGWAWALGKSGVAERYEGGQQQDRPAPRLDRRPLPSSQPDFADSISVSSTRHEPLLRCRCGRIRFSSSGA
jgi:hypothetical protein